MDTFHKIIKEVCEELKIKYKFLSKDWVIMLQKNGVTKFITGYKFDLNNHALGLILDDKYAMYEVLKENNIKVIDHNILYSPTNKNSYANKCNNMDYLEDLFYKYNENVVLKINNGTCGLNVFHIMNISDLEKLYLGMSDKYNSFSLCPYYDIEYEFRVVVLKGETKLVYSKEKPIVYGDGKSTIKELLINFNPNYFNNYNDVNKNIVLAKDEQYVYDWKFNLSRGARMCEEVSIIDKNKVVELALLVSKQLELGFCSVDIIKTNNEYYVLEINSGVMMKNYITQAKDGYNNAHLIYRDAVKEMFRGNL